MPEDSAPQSRDASAPTEAEEVHAERPPGRVPGVPEMPPNRLDRTREKLAGSHGGEMLAEFFGTFFLCLLGCGSVAVAIVGLPGSGRQVLSQTPFGPADWLIIAWGWGFGVVFGVYVCAGISGGHINPAVTLAFALRRGFPWRKVPGYWFAQVVGGFVGAALVYATYFPAINWYNAQNHLTRPHSLNTFAIFATFPAEYFHGSWTGPFIDQVVGTAILVALIWALLDSRHMAPGSNLAPFLIGLVVVVIGMSFGTNAGYAINPARDFGPRLLAYAMGWGQVAFPGHFQWFGHYWWIPIAGPIAGGAVGAFAYDFFAGEAIRARLRRRDREAAAESASPAGER
ncbi:MAG: MIP/aquaporin family protein [Streptosporangiaceae bacterium]